MEYKMFDLTSIYGTYFVVAFLCIYKIIKCPDY